MKWWSQGIKVGIIRTAIKNSSEEEELKKQCLDVLRGLKSNKCVNFCDSGFYNSYSYLQCAINNILNECYDENS